MITIMLPWEIMVSLIFMLVPADGVIELLPQIYNNEQYNPDWTIPDRRQDGRGRL